jgi:glycosyltransferase involved in cell wall biosynthesis
MKNPLVSFIAVSYNHSKFLIETLNSIKNQSFVIDFEIIITDDASKDNSVELIQDWVAQNKNKIKIQTLFNSENIGLCKTLNCAIGLANGQWIKPIACDDVMENKYLEKFITEINKDVSIGLVCSDMSHINNNGVKIRESNWIYNQTEISYTIVNDFNNLLRAQYLNAPSLFYKRNLWEKLGGYDESLIFEDWDFLLRANKITKFAAIKESLVRYRAHDNNMHLNFNTNEKYITDSILLLKKHLTENTKDIIANEVIKQIASLLPINENKAIEIWEQEYTWLKSNKKGPLVSVLIPVYNASAYLENAIKSTLLQTYTNFEIIAVNDGSSDGSPEILEAFKKKDNRINVFNNKINLGLSPTRNLGLQKCKGEYIVLLDADDLMSPNRIQKQVEFLSLNPNVSAVSSSMEVFDVNGKIKIIRYRKDQKDIKSTSMFFSPVSHAASLFNASILKKICYRNELAFAEDFDMWIRFLLKYNVAVMPEVLYFYRFHENQSIKPGNELIKEHSHLKIIESIHNYLKIESTDYLRRFHLKYLFDEEKIDSYELFKEWDAYLQNFLQPNNAYLEREAFCNFIFKNYWQTNFYRLSKGINFEKRLRLIASPFCLLSILHKCKYLLFG